MSSFIIIMSGMIKSNDIFGSELRTHAPWHTLSCLLVVLSQWCNPCTCTDIPVHRARKSANMISMALKGAQWHSAQGA